MSLPSAPNGGGDGDGKLQFGNHFAILLAQDWGALGWLKLS